MLSKIFQRYTGFFRNLRAAYFVNNWLHRDKLARNRALYRQLGLRKSVLAPLGMKDFRGKHSADVPWLDRPDVLGNLEQHPDFQKLDSEMQTLVKQFVEEGYLILKGFFSAPEVEKLNAEVDALLSSGKAGFNYTGRKIMGLTEISETADQQFFKNKRLLDLLSMLLGRRVVPFHSINFIRGSEQRAHSDSIHMTTEPLGYLIAAWVALEDCDADNGPLFFFPGSHRLPFMSTEDYDSGNSFFAIGEHSNAHYEDKIETVLRDNRFEKRFFHANAGDVLIWHANLIHGGSAIRREGATRKSMVCHYFAEGVLCYHEISQRPAIL